MRVFDELAHRVPQDADEMLLAFVGPGFGSDLPQGMETGVEEDRHDLRPPDINTDDITLIFAHKKHP